MREEWNNASILHTILPVLDIREQFNTQISIERAMEYDVILHTNDKLYNMLHVSYILVLILNQWKYNI